MLPSADRNAGRSSVPVCEPQSIAHWLVSVVKMFKDTRLLVWENNTALFSTLCNKRQIIHLPLGKWPCAIVQEVTQEVGPTEALEQFFLTKVNSEIPKVNMCP